MCKTEGEATALDWRTNKDYKDWMDRVDGLKKHSILSFKNAPKREPIEASEHHHRKRKQH